MVFVTPTILRYTTTSRCEAIIASVLIVAFVVSIEFDALGGNGAVLFYGGRQTNKCPIR
jgi:hypothetical protein